MNCSRIHRVDGCIEIAARLTVCVDYQTARNPSYSVCRKLIRSCVCCDESPIWKRWL